MQEKFEHKISNRIREVFDSQQPDYNPQDWERMQEKLGRPKRRVIPFWWIAGRAAVILILIGLGSWLVFKEFIPKQTSISETESFEDGFKKEKATPLQFPEESGKSAVSQGKSEPFNQLGLDVGKSKKPKESANSVSTKQNEFAGNKLEKTIKPEVAKLLVNPIPNDNGKVSADRMIDAEPIISPAQIHILAAANDNRLPLIENPEIRSDNNKRDNKLKFGVEVSSFTNYAKENLEPGMNFGAGVAANIPVIKHLSVSPGIVFSSQKLDYAYENALAESSVITYSTASSPTEYIESNPDIRPAIVQFSALDIPLNLQYTFAQSKKSGYFVELGFSSLLYLDENYTYTFVSSTSGGPLPFGGPNQTGPVYTEIEEDAFQTFDFARLINFSVGWDFSFSKKFDMTLNPYLQYPTGTLTSGDLKFGTGGLKARIMLNP